MTESADCRNKLILKYPASWWRNMWREGLPSGNGKVGASVYGGIQNECILINHEELWHMGKKDHLPDVSNTLEKTRKMMTEERYKEASWHLTNTLKEKGYNTRLASILPLVDLKLTMPSLAEFEKYRRIVNMETGEVTVRWIEGKTKVQYERNLFVSRSDDVIVYEIKSSKKLDAEFELVFHKSDQPSMDERCKQLANKVEKKSTENYLFYATENDDNTDFGAVLRLFPNGGQVVNEGNIIRCQNSNSILVLVKVFVKGERRKEWDKLEKELSDINPNYDELLISHASIHGELFHSASLELGDGDYIRSSEELLFEAYDGEAPTELFEKMWSYGRYLFISGTRNQGQPFGMYGLWGGDYNLMWCHRMANENIQMMYWHTGVGGLTDLNHTLFNYYGAMMKDFRSNAKKLYACNGIYIPAGSSPGIGVPNQIVPVIMNWTSAAGWLAQHYYDHYLYTADEEFLINKALPFLKEVVQFYEDFLVIGKNGYYTYFPSVSPENTPGNFMPKDENPIVHPMPTTKNATMDFAIMKEVITNLIEGSKTCKVYLQEIEKWEEMCSRIPSYLVSEDGAIREWMHPAFEERNDHRHLSHIYPIFPGREFTVEQEPDLFNAFKKTVSNRLLGAQTGWSFAHMSSIYARLNDGNSALKCLNNLSRSCLLTNFFTLHNDWRSMGMSMDIETAPIQMDANMGWVNAIQEMLLYSSTKLVKLLPALPDKWIKGKVNDFRFFTGKVSITWDLANDRFSAEIYAERDTNIIIKLPPLFDLYKFSGENVELSPSSLDESCYYLKMDRGDSLIIKH